MKLVFSRAAVSDLVRLRAFIAVHDPPAARRVATRLRTAISRLTDSPHIGRPVGELPGEIRKLIFGKYVVRYQVRQAAVYILRVWLGREDR